MKTYGPDKDPEYYDVPKMFQQQVEWLKNDQGSIDMDFIIRFESLNEGFEQVKDAIGVEASLPHLNKTRKVNYQDHYNQETRQIIAEWFKDDIAMFGYSFE